jgi:hypothetical protein
MYYATLECGHPRIIEISVNRPKKKEIEIAGEPSVETVNADGDDPVSGSDCHPVASPSLPDGLVRIASALQVNI